MRISFFSYLLLATGLVSAQTTTIEVSSSTPATPTQAILHVQSVNANGSPYTGNCTYRVSEGQSFTALVNDVNSVLFPGSNSDARPGTIIDGKDRYFVAGTRAALRASDGNYYSRALQAVTQHWAGVTCGSGPEISTTFWTQNPPLGTIYPEFPNFDITAFGNRATPTINFTDQSVEYIDPLTGILLKRVTGPADVPDANNTHGLFNYALDVTGNGWTNAQNALTNQQAGTLATTSTPNAPLFLAWNGLAVAATFDLNDTVNDLNLRAYCSGTHGGALQACISINSGVNCASNTVSIACPAAVGEVDAPANYPTPMFEGWGTQFQALSKDVMANQPNVSVWVAGNAVTWVSGAVPFVTDRVAGSRVMITGTAPGCPGNICTTQSVNTPYEMTIQQTVGTDLGGSTMTAAASAGATTLALHGDGNLFPGNHIQIEPGTSNVETVQVSPSYVIGSTTVPLQAPTVNTHVSGVLAYWAGLDDGGINGPNPPGHLAPTGTLAGATTITLTDTSVGLAPGETIVIDLNNPTQENAVVATNYQIGSLTVPLQAPLKNNHSNEGYPPYVGWSNAVTLQDYGAGVMVWMQNTGGSPTVSASFTFDHQISKQFIGGQNAAYDTCSTNMITDINTDRNGNPISPPLTGYLCNLSYDLILWIPSTGEARLMSSYYQQNVGYMSVPNSPFSATDPKSLFATNSANNHLYKATLNNPAGIYLPYNPGITVPLNPDNLVWSDLTVATSPIATQLAAYGGPAAIAYATGVFPTLAYVGTIGGYAIYDTASAYDGPCIKLRAISDTNQLIQAFDSWSTFPLRWGGCHSSPVGFGPYLGLSMNVISDFNNTTPLGGPFTLHVTQMLRGGVWQSFTQPITSATNSNPVTLTSVGNGLDPYFAINFGTGTSKGPQVTISGATGSWAAVNGTWYATVNFNTPNTFTIPIDTTSFGSLTGSLTFSATPPLIHSTVTAISSNTPAVVTTTNSIGNEPVNHRFQDGDAIGFSTASVQQQFFAKVTGYSTSTFAVYFDQALTQPVSPASLQGAINGYVYLAQTCPTGLPAFLSTAMQFDSQGATGVRCVTLLLGGEPCSAFATAAESAAFPCKSDPTNPTKSSLINLQPGDAIRDISRGTFDETMVLVQEVKTSETSIQATFMRWFGNLIGGDNHLTNPSSNSHDVGWTPVMVPSDSHGTETGQVNALDTTSTFLVMDPNFAGGHADLGWGNALGLATFAAGEPDHIVNKTVQQIGETVLTYTKNENPFWANTPQTQMGYNQVESYPGHRQYGAPISEFVWKGDWNALNPAFGSGQSGGAGLIGGMTATSIAGTTYDPGSTTTHVYKVSNVAGAYDRKRTPTYSWAGKFMLADMSGPGSLITDANMWNYCVADNPGECRPTSAQNDTFLVGTGFYNSNDYCITNTFNFTAPCFTGANAKGGWAMQIQIDPVDTTATRMRRLTLGLAAPGMHWSFQTWLQTPGGPPMWGFFSTPYVNGLRNDYFAMKLPPWPGGTFAQQDDPAKRADFIRYQVMVAPAPGATYARARFGYAENGPVTSFFCTSRREACSTDIPTATPTDLFAWVSQPVTRQVCTSTCTLVIPAVSGRMLYYVIDRLNAAGTVISTSPLTAASIQ